MIYLVTGGLGFIGASTVEALETAGHRVRVFDDMSTGRLGNLSATEASVLTGSIMDRPRLRAAMSGVDRVIHLAARTSVPESVARRGDYYRTNVDGTLNVMRAAKDAGVRRVVLASSSAVYGSVAGPMSEDMQISPASPYAATKAATEAIAAAYTDGGLSTVCLRYFNVLGPRQASRGSAIPAFIAAVRAGKPLTIYGAGSRDYVSVNDVAACNVAASYASVPAGNYNVGTGVTTPTVRLAEMVLTAAERRVPVLAEPERCGDVPSTWADMTKALAVLPPPSVSLYEMVQQCVDKMVVHE